MPKRTTEKVSLVFHDRGTTAINTTAIFDDTGDVHPIEQQLADIAIDYDIIITREVDESLEKMRGRLIEELKDKIDQIHLVIEEVEMKEIDEGDDA